MKKLQLCKLTWEPLNKLQSGLIHFIENSLNKYLLDIIYMSITVTEARIQLLVCVYGVEHAKQTFAFTQINSKRQDPCPASPLPFLHCMEALHGEEFSSAQASGGGWGWGMLPGKEKPDILLQIVFWDKGLMTSFWIIIWESMFAWDQ